MCDRATRRIAPCNTRWGRHAPTQVKLAWDFHNLNSHSICQGMGYSAITCSKDSWEAGTWVMRIVHSNRVS